METETGKVEVKQQTLGSGDDGGALDTPRRAKPKRGNSDSATVLGARVPRSQWGWGLGDSL